VRSFAVDVLGMQVVGQDTDEFVELAMGDGARLELFGSIGAAYGPWMFERSPVVAGFLVDDINSARGELARARGIELLGELRVMPDGYGWQDFRGHDGHVDERASTAGRLRPSRRSRRAGRPPCESRPQRAASAGATTAVRTPDDLAPDERLGAGAQRGAHRKAGITSAP
jgi:hypothetical protein